MLLRFLMAYQRLAIRHCGLQQQQQIVTPQPPSVERLRG
nr:MAG TPA: hypothetical protein [Caudoviricetes sp.]